jgi:uncharacterized protein
MPEGLSIAKGNQEHLLLPRMANRHGLIAGATGTGKTVTLRVIAEQLSRLGVPVFMADVKGDLSGIAHSGQGNPKIAERVSKLGIENFQYTGYPTVFWDLYGDQGIPVRATISDMGPLLMSRLLNLNETQGGVLNLVFKVARDENKKLDNLKNLQKMLEDVGDNAAQFKTRYGNVSTASIGAIQRSLLELEEQGADKFFGLPKFDLGDMKRTVEIDKQKRGVINILAADQLMKAPKLYATFLFWLLNKLFEELPEVGDPKQPELVFFFDEAHLLFDDAPEAFREKIEQVVRLIRSKGVGVYFCTQNPLDVPDVVLGQLGNRVQHALRAFTPRDQKAVKAAAETFRQNPQIDVETAITELGVGEALVSFLDEKGQPSVVDRALIYPPQSQLAPLRKDELMHITEQSDICKPIFDKYKERRPADEELSAQPPQEERPSGPRGKTSQSEEQSLSERARKYLGSREGQRTIRSFFGLLRDVLKTIMGATSRPPKRRGKKTATEDTEY